MSTYEKTIDTVAEDLIANHDVNIICKNLSDMPMLTILVVQEKEKGTVVAIQPEFGIASRTETVWESIQELSAAIGKEIVENPERSFTLPSNDRAYLIPAQAYPEDAIAEYADLRQEIEESFHLTLPDDPADVLWISAYPQMPKHE